ncbi:Conjugative transposon protein TcpC, partial [Geodermatophilus obscurus]
MSPGLRRGGRAAAPRPGSAEQVGGNSRIGDHDVRLQGRWTGGSKVATKAATGLLWTLLICGPLGLVAGAAAFLAAPPPAAAQAPAEADTMSEQAAVGEFAQRFVATWLTTPRGEESTLAGFVDTSGVQLPQVPWSVADPATAAIAHVATGRWTVTVAVTVTEPPPAAGAGPAPSQTPPPVRRFFSVPVAYDQGALLAQTLPAPVAAPAPAAPVPLAYGYTAPGQHPASTAAAEFLVALLTGTGDVDRYVTPGTRVQAITPAPYAQVRLQRVQVDADPADLPDVPGNGDQLHALVTAEATSAAGQALSVQYALTLTARGGRWEVQSV